MCLWPVCEPGYPAAAAEPLSALISGFWFYGHMAELTPPPTFQEKGKRELVFNNSLKSTGLYSVSPGTALRSGHGYSQFTGGETEA